WRRPRGGFLRIDCAGRKVGDVAEVLAECSAGVATLFVEGADALGPDDVAKLRRILDGRAADPPLGRGQGSPYRTRHADPAADPADLDTIVGLRDAEH